MSSILILVAVLACVGSPGAARPEGADDKALGRGPGVPAEVLEGVFAEARGDLLEGLEKHAEWCNAAKLYLERNKVYERILTLDPDHVKARTGLGYRKRDGEWTLDPKKSRPPKNYRRGKLKEAAQRLAAVLEPYGAHLYFFLDERGKELSPPQLGRILDELLAMNPDDERARALRGETRVEVENAETGEMETAWVLVETARAKERRHALSRLVRDLFKSAPPAKRVAPSAKDTGIGLPWTSVLATDRFRVVGTVGEKEAAQTLRAVHVAEGYFNGVFGTKVALEEGMTVYLLADPAQKDALIDAHPDPLPDERAYLKTLDGSGIPGSQDIGHWAKSGQRRADGVVRVALGNLFTRAFHITTDEAWAYEGFGLYMTYQIVRSRLNWFALPSRNLMDDEEKALRSRMIRPETGWMQEAYELLQREEHPPLLDVLDKRMGMLTTYDLLLSYVLAAFLLEAHPDETPSILQSIGEGGDAGLVLRDRLGLGPDGIESRILRWLSERK